MYKKIVQHQLANNIIPNEVLEHFVCSSCKKYLSVKPIRVYPNRQIKCGRCVEEGDNGVDSLYGLFAEELLFPCINRYESCNNLLGYSEVENHEKNCHAGSYPCLICTDFYGSAYELFTHFKEVHTNNVLYSDEFPIDIKAEQMDQYYLHCRKNFLLMVHVKCDLIYKEVLLKITFIGPEHKGYYLKYNFVIYNLKRDIKYVSKMENCLPIGKNTDYHGIQFRDLPKKERMFICKIEINASECEGLIVFNHQHLQIKSQPKHETIKKDNLSVNKLKMVQESSLTKSPKLNKFFSLKNENNGNEEINFYDILESPFRPSIKRKLFIDLRTSISHFCRVSEDQTSVIYTNGHTHGVFEMICYGCKQNLPIFRDLSTLEVSPVVYGCGCPNNIVCEICFSKCGFKKCKDGHHYEKQTFESTILVNLKYRSWKNNDLLQYSQLGRDFNLNYGIYCSAECLGKVYNLLDITPFLKSKSSIFQKAVCINHVTGANRVYPTRRIPSYIKLYFPFFNHTVNLKDILDQTFIYIVDTLIVIEKFNDCFKTFVKVKFYEKLQNKNKSIVSIVNSENFCNFQIFKGDFWLWNNNNQTTISFRII